MLPKLRDEAREKLSTSGSMRFGSVLDDRRKTLKGIFDPARSIDDCPTTVPTAG